MSIENKAGFVGLGAMGSALARRLLKGGLTLHVYDPDASKVAALVALGAVAQGSARAVADVSEVVYACLPDSGVSKDVAYGEHGVNYGKALKVYVETSTIGRVAIQTIAARLGAAGIAVIDAPVSGGPRGADAGTLSMILSGSEAALAQVRSQVDLICKKRFEVGSEPGMGQMMKLVNNLISAANMASAYEALVLGAKAGLDADQMIEVINASTGRNSATVDKIPTAVLTRTFDYGASIRTIHKDVSIGLEEAQALNVPMWVGQNIKQLWEFAMTQGGGDLDFTALITYMEQWTGVQVRGRAAVAAVPG